MRRLIPALALLLILTACQYSGPSVFWSEAGLVACGTAGVDHDPLYGDPAHDPHAGAVTAIRSGHCQGGEINGATKNWATVVYYSAVHGVPTAWDCGHAERTQVSGTGLVNVVWNERCRFFHSGDLQSYPQQGFYAGVAHHGAWFFGTFHSTLGGYPQASPWEYVDLCPVDGPLCDFETPASFSGFTEGDGVLMTVDEVLEAVDYQLLIPGPDTDYSDPSTAVGVTDLKSV